MHYGLSLLDRRKEFLLNMLNLILSSNPICDNIIDSSRALIKQGASTAVPAISELWCSIQKMCMLRHIQCYEIKCLNSCHCAISKCIHICDETPKGYQGVNNKRPARRTSPSHIERSQGPFLKEAVK